MAKKLVSGVLFIMILISLTTITLNVNGSSPTPSVSVYDPVTQGNVSSAPIGQNFTVQITVADVKNLQGWDFWLTFNTSLLSYVGNAEGPFLNSSSAYQSYYVPIPPGTRGHPVDTFYAGDTLLAATLSTTASGSGVLGTVTFKVLAEGIGKLDLHNSTLVGFSTASGVPPTIAHTEQSGYFALPLPITAVEPAERVNSGILPGQNVNFTIAVSNTANVYNWTLTLQWEPDILNVTSVTEGSFLKNAGATIFSTSVNRTAGLLFINDTFTGEPSGGVSGNGTLATVYFNVLARGTTDITITKVAMFKKDGTFVPSATVIGLFSNIIHDVAITSVTLSSNSVNKGQFVDITVVVSNHGVVNETFTVRVDYDSQNIGTQPVNNLAPNANQTLVFRWDTTKVADGTYTIKATASTIPGESNTANNVQTAGPITIGGGSGLNLMLIGAVIAAIVVIAIVVFFLLRRRSKKK